MANVRSNNTHYIDSTGALIDANVKVVGITLTATAANAVLLLKNYADSRSKIDLRVATSGATEFFNFAETPLVFPDGIYVKTLTNAIATLIYNNSGG